MTLVVTSGVPHGSVLGPTLFLIYINDLPDCINCNVSLYADDTLLYAPINNDTDRLLFQADIDSLHEWSSTNKMPFNTAKCEVIAFNSRGNLPPSYMIGEHSLNYVDEIKYLGVVMQSNLKFDGHIASKVNRAKKVLGCIKYALNDAPQSAKLLAYSSLVCRCSMGSSQRSLNTRTRGSTQQSNKICQKH